MASDIDNSVVVVAIPAADDPVHGMGPEDKHATILYFGDLGTELPGGDVALALIREAVEAAAAQMAPFTAQVAGIDQLGHDDGPKAQVWMLDSPELHILFEQIPAVRPEVADMYDIATANGVHRFPEYLPHVTIGYEDEMPPLNGDMIESLVSVEKIRFDRLAVWHGSEQTEYPLGGEMSEQTETAARKWFGVLAPEGVPSGDKRMFAEGALRMRSLPLPLTWQKFGDQGHDGHVTVASIEEVWRENGLIWGAGDWLDTPEADEAYALVDKFGRYGVSIDADDLDEFSIEMDEDGVTVFTDARTCSACIVSIPAFAEAFVMNGDYEDFKADFAGGWGAPSQNIPTRENEGQAECEHRDDDGRCLDREPDAERKAEAAMEEPPGECSCDEADENYDPDCVCDEDDLDDEQVTVPEGMAVEAKDYTPEERKDAHTIPGTDSFPIEDCEDLKNAIQAIGRAKDPAAAKKHIRTQKKRLGCPDVEIPDTWALDLAQPFLVERLKGKTYAEIAETFHWDEEMIREVVESICESRLVTDGVEFADVAPGKTEDGPGWLTHPVDTDRLRDYWVSGPGAAKIAWGAPGDFDRCRANVAEYVKPQYLNGYCANRHYDALGYWPGQTPHQGEIVTMTNGVEVASLTAAADAAPPPMSWFTDPQFATSDERMIHFDGKWGCPLTITDDGEIYGHLAVWGVCHIGFDGVCIEPPHSPSDYAYYRLGLTETDAGYITTGAITMDTGHASTRLRGRPAAAHYDNTGTVVANVATGEDEFGIWYHGALSPECTAEHRRKLLASGGLSGDWREFGGKLELVAALAVNVPGFAVPRLQVAAGDRGTVALVAAGMVPPRGEVKPPIVPDGEFVAKVKAAMDEWDKDRARRQRRHAALRERLHIEES